MSSENPDRSAVRRPAAAGSAWYDAVDASNVQRLDMNIEPIKNEADYDAALTETEGLMGATPDTPEAIGSRYSSPSWKPARPHVGRWRRRLDTDTIVP